MSTPVPSLKLKANAKSRVLSGHPWVFANEVEALLSAENDGTVVECRDRAGRFLGSGIYNSKSQIIWRRLSAQRVTLDEAYIRGALTRAIARRDPTSRHRRLVWSESDDLPGVVVDQFGDTLVLQIQSLAMDQRGDLIVELLAELLSPTEIIVRNDAHIRKLEGLPLGVHTRSGQAWAPRWEKIDGFDYWLDLQSGQKTGFIWINASSTRFWRSIARASGCWTRSAIRGRSRSMRLAQARRKCSVSTARRMPSTRPRRTPSATA